MSSNFEVLRICMHCDKEFMAKTTVTKYCSHNCSRNAWRKRARGDKIENSNRATFNISTDQLQKVQIKEYLSVRDVSLLLHISIRTTYRLISEGTIRSTKISERITIIKRSDIDSLFAGSQIEHTIEQKELKITECYSLDAIKKNYNISESALYQIIKRNNIPKLKKGKFLFLPKDQIDSILKKSK